MSEVDETVSSEVESQAADTQEETVVEDDTQQAADETQTDEAEAQESADDEAEESTDETLADGEEQQKPPQKTKQDYIRERIERREQKNALRQAQEQFNQNIDPEDALQRLEAIENERFVERVENNISNARRDIIDAQNLPVFKNDPEAFADFITDAHDIYGVYHDSIEDPSTVTGKAFLGFYDPRTGQPISLLNIAQREAAKLGRVAGRIQTSAQVKAADNEAKMRARANEPGGGKNSVDSKGDAELSPEAYAKKYNLGTIRA